MQGLQNPQHMSVKNAGDVENLNSTEAIKKMQELVKQANIGMFTTNLSDIPLNTRPMATQQVDDEGSLWYFSGASTDKNQHIQNDSRVQIMYANNSGYEYLTVYGTATVSRDRAKIEELWTEFAKAWFQGGKDDPELTLIKVKPEYAYYWDTKSNKMISLIKILTSVVTGKSSDNGIEGTLKV